MSRGLPVLFLFGVLSCVSGIRAQVVESLLPLSDGDPATFDNPFGIAIDPDGQHAYVALAGLLPPLSVPPSGWPLYNNNKVVKVDLQTGLQVGVATVGYFPEEIVLSLDATGQTRHVYVSNSTDGTLTCLTPALAVVATIPLSACFGGTYASSFPFGLLASPDSTRLYAQGTSCWTFDVIDIDPASPSFNTILSTFLVPEMFGRPTWVTYPTLAVPITHYNYNPALASFDWSQTGITLVDVTNPNSQSTIWGHAVQQFSFPSITDLATLPNGRVLGGIGFGTAPLLVEFDPVTASVTRTLDLSPSVGSSLHGLSVRRDGKVAVLTVLDTSHTAYINVSNFAIQSILPAGQFALPNEVVFTHDQSRAVVTLNGLSALQVITEVPGYSLELLGPAIATQGSMATYSLQGVEFGSQVGLFASLGPGPTTIASQSVYLSNPITLMALESGTPSGGASIFLDVPLSPALTGLTIHFQAGTTDRNLGIRLSGALSTLIP